MTELFLNFRQGEIQSSNTVWIGFFKSIDRKREKEQMDIKWKFTKKSDLQLNLQLAVQDRRDEPFYFRQTFSNLKSRSVYEQS